MGILDGLLDQLGDAITATGGVLEKTTDAGIGVVENFIGKAVGLGATVEEAAGEIASKTLETVAKVGGDVAGSSAEVVKQVEQAALGVASDAVSNIEEAIAQGAKGAIEGAGKISAAAVDQAKGTVGHLVGSGDD